MKPHSLARRLLVDARARAGLTQQQLADRAEVSQPAIAAYETGRRQPTLPTLHRLLRAAGFEPRIRLEPSSARDEPQPGRRWAPPSSAATSRGIYSALRHKDPSEALRWVAQFIAGVERAPLDQRAPLVSSTPATTGDRRWDAMLAGAAEHICHQHGLAIPAWCADSSRSLDEAWFVIETILGEPSPRLAVSAFAESPAEFANRGVFIHASSVKSA